MAIFPETTLLPRAFLHNKRSKEQAVASPELRKLSSLRRYVSIPSLSSIVRGSFTKVGDVFEGYRDGLSQEEREEKQRTENRKQVLYLKMRNVSPPILKCDALYTYFGLLTVLHTGHDIQGLATLRS